MKILFIGCVKSSKILLQELIYLNKEIVGVITKKESLYNSDFEDLSTICKKNNLDYKFVNTINENETIEYIMERKPDVIYCFGWSELIKKRIIEIPSKGIVGFHPAQLPQNRGRHPIIWALVLGLRETASTFFFINEKADEGNILSQEKISIAYEEDANTLYNKIMQAAKKQIKILTEQLESNTYVEVNQTSKATNYWRKRSIADGKIDWRMSSKSIYNLVRGLTKPYVGAHFEYNNKEIKVWKVKEVFLNGIQNIEYGKIMKIYEDETVLIKVGDNAIHILEYEGIEIEEGMYLQ